MQESDPGPPVFEREACFKREEPLHRSHTCPLPLAELTKATVVGGVGQHHRRNPRHAFIARPEQLQRLDSAAPHLVQQQLGQGDVPGDATIQGVGVCNPREHFPQQRLDGNGATLLRRAAATPRGS